MQFVSSLLSLINSRNTLLNSPETVVSSFINFTIHPQILSWFTLHFLINTAQLFCSKNTAHVCSLWNFGLNWFKSCSTHVPHNLARLTYIYKLDWANEHCRNYVCVRLTGARGTLYPPGHLPERISTGRRNTPLGRLACLPEQVYSFNVPGHKSLSH